MRSMCVGSGFTRSVARRERLAMDLMRIFGEGAGISSHAMEWGRVINMALNMYGCEAMKVNGGRTIVATRGRIRRNGSFGAVLPACIDGRDRISGHVMGLHAFYGLEETALCLKAG